MFEQPVGARFHQIIAVAGVFTVVWTFSWTAGMTAEPLSFGPSSMGSEIATGILLVVLLLTVVLAAAWLIRLVGYAWHRRSALSDPASGRLGTSAPRWLLAPAMAAVLVVALASTPSLVWQFSTQPTLQSTFVDAELTVDPTARSPRGDWRPVLSPTERIGTTQVDGVMRLGHNVAILDESVGAVFLRGGIAYLPNGTADVAEWPWSGSRVAFSELGDGWYSWRQSF